MSSFKENAIQDDPKKQLTSRELDVLLLFFLFELSDEQIGSFFNSTRERITQVRTKGIKKLGFKPTRKDSEGILDKIRLSTPAGNCTAPTFRYVLSEWEKTIKSGYLGRLFVCGDWGKENHSTVIESQYLGQGRWSDQHHGFVFPSAHDVQGAKKTIKEVLYRGELSKSIHANLNQLSTEDLEIVANYISCHTRSDMDSNHLKVQTTLTIEPQKLNFSGLIPSSPFFRST